MTGKCLQSCSNAVEGQYFADSTTGRCVLVCLASNYLFADINNQNICSPTCFQPATPFYADNITRSCVSTCPQATYGYSGNFTCLSKCPNDTISAYYIDKVNQICVTSCASTTTFADDSTG